MAVVRRRPGCLTRGVLTAGPSAEDRPSSKALPRLAGRRRLADAQWSNHRDPTDAVTQGLVHPLTSFAGGNTARSGASHGRSGSFQAVSGAIA